MDLSEFLPPGEKLSQAKRPKLSLTEFLSEEILEPEIFSDPLALELHMARTTCRCGQEFLAPEGAFVEVHMKRLQGKHYKAIGSVLIPISSERSLKLQSVPHRIRTREIQTVVCHLCLDKADLYKDLRVQPHEEWEARRPKVLSEAWRKFQLEVNPSTTKLRELISHIEARERFKDFDPQPKPRLCDPETNLEE